MGQHTEITPKQNPLTGDTKKDSEGNPTYEVIPGDDEKEKEEKEDK